MLLIATRTGQHCAHEFIPFLQEWLAFDQSKYGTATRISEMSFSDLLGCSIYSAKQVKYYPLYAVTALSEMEPSMIQQQYMNETMEVSSLSEINFL